MRRWGRRLAAGLVAGGVLLTGCTGSGDTENLADDSSRGRQDAGRNDAPMPGGSNGPPAGAKEGAQQGEGGERKGEVEDTAPVEPDYLSTFALDVDTASYSYARRTINDGRMPAADTVRPEEFVNSFRQGYPQPEGDGFTVTADGARTGSGQWSLLRVGLATKEEPPDAAERRAPAALTFVIDISGSMDEPGRLDLVKSSLRKAVGKLRAKDSVSLVTFSDEATTVLPMTRLDGDGPRDDVRDAVDGLEPADSTNLAAGMRKGYEEAVEGKRKGATNRVVLLSDALANTGDTSAETILDQIATHRAEHGITLFGVGVGSDYGDSLMERLTNKGDGHTTYVSTEKEAQKVFVDELPRNIDLRARDAKAQVAFDPSTVEQFRLIGYDNRKVADEDFRDDRVDGGEIGPGHTVTALYAVQLKEGASGKVATSTVRWLEPDSRTPHEESRTVGTETLRGDLWDEAEPRLRLTAVAAYFAESLRGREHGLPDTPTLGQLAGYARDIASRTEDKAASRLADTISRADELG
ncbi:von Willebrand factor type A domain-containing protein [Streptomyces sp. N2-109]|uniref:von Willebrand factor type A domain-containing protein n=1 Tax=Streptomyces gossypii TaxID=2883101 RepID=A0ABT2JSZ5_9ACTN|nr:von Willebrand factor type A domain-containing protein [Streptomyces gossypii]MCT2591012.1 von Willebrand factor type A domain-containing protein [Streptomyces gossypii]